MAYTRTRRYSRTRSYPTTRRYGRFRRSFVKSRFYNKRKFRQTLKQNAIYYKVKRVIPFLSPSNTSTCRLGINLNANEAPTSNSDISGALWTQVDTSNPTFYGMGDFPNFENQYDQVRIAGVSIKWMPGLPNGSITTAYSPMTIAYDRDGIEGDVRVSNINDQMEQVNAVSVKNMYRPWKRYIKPVKYGIGTRIPSIVQDPDNFGVNYNLAGQWKPVRSYLTRSWQSQTVTNNRGTHILVQCQTPQGAIGDQVLLGTFVVTSYFVFKDRK